MIIIPIFANNKKHSPCKLWSACFKEDYSSRGKPYPVFDKIFNQWNDAGYLVGFFKNNIADLQSAFWKGMTPDKAIQNIMDEAYHFEVELKSIELGAPGYQNSTFKDVFVELNKNEFALKNTEKNFRKAKPDFKGTMLRIYAIELEGECFVVTGGAIKLTEKMKEGNHLLKEKDRLMQVQGFLKEEGIYSLDALLETYNK